MKAFLCAGGLFGSFLSFLEGAIGCTSSESMPRLRNRGNPKLRFCLLNFSQCDHCANLSAIGCNGLGCLAEL